MQTKTAQIQAAMAAQDWPLALRLAARLPRLDRHGPAIKRAHECAHSPAFYRAIGKDPAALIAAGKAALIERFG